MNKAIVIILVSFLILGGTVFSSPQLIQNLKENLIPSAKEETGNALLIDDNFDFGDTDNRSLEDKSEEKSEVKGTSITTDDSYNSPAQISPTKPPSQSSGSNTNYYVPVPVYQQSDQSSSYNDPYWDWQIRQADKEAQEAEEAKKEREVYDEYCKEVNAQRSAAVAPIRAQIDAVLAEMERQKAEIDARTDLSEADKDWAKMKISGGELFDQWMDLQEEYNRVYAQYGSC